MDVYICKNSLKCTLRTKGKKKWEIRAFEMQVIEGASELQKY